MKRTLALVLLLISGLLAPAAQAAHPTSMCLDLEPDQQTVTFSDVGGASPVAYPGTTDADHPAQYEGCGTELNGQYNDWGGTNIDFEITGAGDTDDSDSPASPDMTCTVVQGGGWCSPPGPSPSEGVQTIRGWIDADLNNATVEADLSEGYAEVAEPGTSPEPDTTDVVEWIYESQSMVEHSSSVSIAFRRSRGVFLGRVSSDSHEPCAIDRVVKLFKLLRDGWRLKATTQTNEDGIWKVTGFRRSHGRYRAIAPRHVTPDEEVCIRGRSPALRVP